MAVAVAILMPRCGPNHLSRLLCPCPHPLPKTKTQQRLLSRTCPTGLMAQMPARPLCEVDTLTKSDHICCAMRLMWIIKFKLATQKIVVKLREIIINYERLKHTSLISIYLNFILRILNNIGINIYKYIYRI